MTKADEFLNIDTPENVVFGYEIVGIGSRFMATLVDSLIIGIILVIVILTVLFITGNFLDPEGIFSSVVLGLLGLMAFLFVWGYYIFFELYWNGRSPGKQLVGLRVIRRDGTPVTLAESVIRNLIRLIDFLPFAYGVGIVSMFIDSQSRRLGDMAANTLVVRDHEDVTLESLARSTAKRANQEPFSPQSEMEYVVADWPLERLDEDDIQLIEQFLQRRYSLENEQVLAKQISDKLLHKMEIDKLQTTISYRRPTNLLETILKVYRSRR